LGNAARVLHLRDMKRPVSHLLWHISLQWVVSAAAVALILVLGALQFRWFNELNDRELEGRRIRVAADVARFCDALDTELTRMYLSFQLDGDGVARRDALEVARDYELWRRQARYPRLLRGIWIAEPVEPASPGDADTPGAASSWRFLRLDVTSRSFVETPLPRELASLGRRLVVSPTDVGKRPGAISPFLDYIDEDTLSIIRPFPVLLRTPVAAPAPEATGGNHAAVQRVASTTIRFAILQLDREYLVHELLPDLARQYFSESPASASLDYQMVIVRNRTPQTIVYTSGLAASGIVPPAVDAMHSLLGIRSSLAAGGSTVLIRSPFVARGFQRGAASQANGAVGLLSSNDVEYWQLRVTHRTGSLEALAARARRQNLLLTAMTVVLLSGSVVVLLVALRRSLMLNRQRMEFIAGVSHELRTPVAVMRMTGANLAEGLVTEHQDVQRYGRLVQREARRLMEMTEQVLSLARLESTADLPTESVAPAALIQAVVELKRPEIDELGLRCTIALEKFLPAVQGNRASLERALQNLLSNAIKYSHARGEIRICAGKEERGGRTWVWISVEDDGIGIDPDELSSIFEPFQRGRAAIERNIPGTGLGLSLVERIVRTYGGEVRARSEPGKGSVFTLHLPAERE
jgi:two-component system, OmpR family, sensor histidine kinase SenX3